MAIFAVAVAGLLAPSVGQAKSVRCETLVSTPWTFHGTARTARGQRYEVVAERLPCFVAVRLATQLIPLRTKDAFARASPPGYVCVPLGVSANRYRPATAVGLCLQKPVASPRDRSFSWRPVPGS